MKIVERESRKLKTHMIFEDKTDRKKAANYLTYLCKWLSEQVLCAISTFQILLKVTKERTLEREMITHVLKRTRFRPEE